VATLFAIELELAGNVAAGELLVGTVFAVIFATVAIEAGLARQIGDVLEYHQCARSLSAAAGSAGRSPHDWSGGGEYVVIVEIDDEEIERARSGGSPCTRATAATRRRCAARASGRQARDHGDW